MNACAKRLTLTLLVSTAILSGAYAQDVPPVAAALLKNMETQLGAKPTYDKLEMTDGDDFTIRNLKVAIAAEGAKPGVNVTIESIDFADVGDAENGVMTVGTVTYGAMKGDMNQSGFDYSFEIPSAISEGFHIALPVDAPTPAQSFRASLSLIDKSTVDLMTIKIMGQTLTITDYDATWSGDKVTGTGKYVASIGDIAIPESAIAALDTAGQLKALGYAGLNLSLAGEGEMSMNNDAMSVDFKTEIAAKDMGTLSLSGAVGEISLAGIAALPKPNADPALAMQEAEKAMALYSAMSIGKAEISFEDASITAKLLPMAAAAMGTDAATFIGTAPAQIQAGMMMFGVPEFSKQASEAVGAYLKDPKSLTITVAPAAPVKIDAIVAAGSANPASIVGLLGLSVTSND